MIHVFYSQINREYHDFLINSYLNILPKGLQKRILNYSKWEDAQLTLLGRILLMLGVESFYEMNEVKNFTFNYSEYNKPYLENLPVKFNISHSGDIVVCALLTFAEIGIDIEKIQPINVNEFKSQMTSNEWELISKSNNKLDTFYNYWTQKEAVLKALGMGLSFVLKSFEVKNSYAMVKGEFYSIKELNIDPNYKCHMAVKKNINHKDLKYRTINIDVSRLCNE